MRGRQDLRVKFARREKNLLDLKAYLQMKLWKFIDITNMILSFLISADLCPAKNNWDLK